MLRWLTAPMLDALAAFEGRFARAQTRRRWERLQALGMRIGKDVVLPRETWIDIAHCYLIDIGDGCHFGPHCLILAHDAQMDEFLDAGRLGKVIIGPGCQIGARSVILCNVEIGAGTVVEAGSVVATSLPAGTYCAGSPARVVSTVAQYAERLVKETAGRPSYTPEALAQTAREADGRRALIAELTRGPALIRRG